MRALHLTADWKWTGPAEPMLHAVASLRGRGHCVDVAFPAAPPEARGALDERARERGIEPALVLERERGYHPLRDRAQVRRLRELFDRGRYDLVHVHHTRDHLLARAARFARGGPAPALVASWHHGRPIPGTPWSRWLFGGRGASGITVLSEDLAARACRTLRRAPAQVGVLPGVVDTEAYVPREPSGALRSQLGLSPGARVLGVVARLQPHRRFDLLLEAFRRASELAPELRLVVVGRGTRAASVLEDPVRALGLQDRVLRVGFRRDDYRDVLSLFDALVFLVPGSDGSCRAVLEAMSMGIPTIASRRELLSEIVVSGETGALVEERPDALADAFLDLWREPDRWLARGKAARERAFARYALAHHADRLECFYSGLVSSMR